MNENKYGPKKKYHKEHGSVICKSQDEEDLLGDGWEDTPAGIDADSEDGHKKIMHSVPIAKFLVKDKPKKKVKKQEKEEKKDFLSFDVEDRARV